MQLVVVVAAMFPSLSHFPTFFVNCVQKFSSNFTAASWSLLLAAAQVQLGNILLTLSYITCSCFKVGSGEDLHLAAKKQLGHLILLTNYQGAALIGSN